MSNSFQEKDPFNVLIRIVENPSQETKNSRDTNVFTRESNPSLVLIHPVENLSAEKTT